ncbi:MAG: ATP-dependent Clp protease proteolytic subunit, partial [Euryarchaeota archaeon]|nr:ATP-dependent Clp protease proteolytic subunit [Euryarchaeota archaeon]
IHQPLGGMQGQASDVEIQANELVRWKKVLTEIYVKHTGRSYQDLEKDMDRDNFMTAQEAVAYGLVDRIIENRD